MISTRDIDTVRGGTAYDRSGSKLGKVGEVYLDNSSGEPAWVTVHTGLFGNRQTFVPLQGASLDGGDLHLPHDKAAVKDAPNIGDDEALSPDAEQALYRHYGVDPRAGDQQGTDQQGTDQHGTGERHDDRRDDDRRDERPREEKRMADEHGEHDGREDRDGARSLDRDEHHGAGTAAAGTAATLGSHDRDHRDDDRGVTERRDDDRTSAPSARSEGVPGPRLRKHVVTEMQTITVPVEREVYTLEDGTPVDSTGTPTGETGRHQDGDRR